jgi:hypothetical protein
LYNIGIVVGSKGKVPLCKISKIMENLIDKLDILKELY